MSTIECYDVEKHEGKKIMSEKALVIIDIQNDITKN